MATYAGAPPGSGANFAKLKSALAKRGVRNPAGLAAHIGRKKYGHKGMAKLSAMGHSHSNVMGFTGSEEGGYKPGAYAHSHTVTHSHEYASLTHTHEGTGGGYTPRGGDSYSGVRDLEVKSSKLLMPQSGGQHSTGFQAQRLGVTSRTGNYGSMSNTEQRAVSLAQRTPVASPWDIVVSRGKDGSAQIRHRRGGLPIGSIKRTETGGWTAAPDGGDALPERAHQRAALLDLLGTWNRGQSAPERPAVPYMQPAQQTPLMERFGVPAIRALATPMTSAGSGPRVTKAGGDTSGGEDTGGLSPRGKAIYAKLRSRGFPAERALAFAKRAQNMGAK